MTSDKYHSKMIRHLSLVTCHYPLVTRHSSLVTCHSSLLIDISEAETYKSVEFFRRAYEVTKDTTRTKD